MGLARRAHVALVMLMLCAAISAQTLRPDTDPRNLSPTVGTGGPVGGPTGLFTVYDGQTLRKGEFTFSIALSDYHRDPGDVKFQDYPASFNIGLNDHIELFFNTTAYRGVKVNSPANLSSFYLPNSQLFFGPGQLGSGAAIVLAPNGSGSLRNTALFRPAFNQPFVQFPFIGGSAGTFGEGPGVRGGLFGFPGFAPTLGNSSAGNGNFGTAGNFPGIGSPVGSILPGIVLSTVTLPATALTLPITVPTVFTVAPSYLPDAPFINRLYGESELGTFVAGAKIRFTGPNNPLGFGVIPFYRFYHDRPNTFNGFNDLQRGSSPGGNIGDFGAIVFLDGRLGKHVNLSANGGYILNSNPRSTAFGGGQKVTLLDRPNELITGVGFDFPINKHFQPMAELTTDRYVGSRTPNAFENSPVDIVLGAKLYPKRWFGIGLAYRRHLNYQSADHFKLRDFNTQVSQITGVNVPRRGVVIVPGTAVASTANGLPLGFRESNDPNGFIGQVFVGRRNSRSPRFLPNQPPVISSFTASSATVTIPCPPGTSSTSCPTSGPQSVSLTTNASDPDGDTLLYTYSVTGGRVTGEGPNVSWDLTGVTAGSYTATVEVDDGCGCVAFTSTTVTVATCPNCVTPCPTVNVSCPDTVDAGAPITFTANVAGGSAGMSPTYTWSVSAGNISSGQGTSSITVDSASLSGQTVTATVEIGGLAPECTKTASCSAAIKGVPQTLPRKFDEYGNIRFNDEKARLDNFAIELQNAPGSQGYIVVYGSCSGEGQARADRAKGYLVNTRGIDASRIVTVDGGCRTDLTVQLWIVPSGATAPAADATGSVTPCPECRIKRPGRRRGARRAGSRRRGDDDEE